MSITQELRKELNTRRDAISTHKDLAEFLEFLEAEYQDGGIEQKDAGDLIGDASDVVSGLEVLLKQDGLSLPDRPDWKLVGGILLWSLLRD